MPRIRTIKPEFWKSESIAGLPFRTRLTFVGLWTYVDDNGVGLDNYKLIAAELFGLEEDPREARANIREDLARLHSAGRILRYAVGSKRYLAIVNWDEHQKIDKPGKPRHPDPTQEDACLLSREDAWAMDAPRGLPAQDSRDSRETFAPGTGNREQGTGDQGTGDQGTGDSAKADNADALSSAQESFPGMPAEPPANLPAKRRATRADADETKLRVQAIVAAFVEGSDEAGLDKPSGALLGRVGNRARALLSEGKDFDGLIEAARALGPSEYTDLDTAYRKRDARSKGVGSDHQGRAGSALSRRPGPEQHRPSTSAARARQALDVAARLDAKYTNGATA